MPTGTKTFAKQTPCEVTFISIQVQITQRTRNFSHESIVVDKEVLKKIHPSNRVRYFSGQLVVRRVKLLQVASDGGRQSSRESIVRYVQSLQLMQHIRFQKFKSTFNLVLGQINML
mmetsp:Transcript_130440/g.377338  ORF Transcript_130440/g.377338 Transcript_130440/m.377338 type:complete len:116 (+) Transcript_130440:229-576(+)